MINIRRSQYVKKYKTDKKMSIPQKKNRWLRRIIAFSSAMIFVVTPGYVAAMCSGNGLLTEQRFEPPAPWPMFGSSGSGVAAIGLTGVNDLIDGGIDLNKTLTLLNEIDDISGAAYDADRGEIILIGQGGGAVAEPIDLHDLVVAVRTVYSVDEDGYQVDPGISFEEVNFTQPSSFIDGKMKVRYNGATQDTQFGQILFDADYILKTLGQGVDQYGVRLTEYNVPTAVVDVHCPGITSATLNSCLGYMGSAERFITNGVSLSDIALKFWIEPKTIELASFSDEQNPTQARSFEFSDVSMQVCFNVLDGNGNYYRDSGNNVYSDDYCPDDTIPNIDAFIHAKAFSANITQYYDAYSEIIDGDGFHQLKKLKHLAKVVGLVRWLRDSNIPVDLSFLEGYRPAAISTPRLVDILQLCHSDGVIDFDNSGAFSGTCPNNGSSTVKMITGGVTYATENSLCDSASTSCPDTTLVDSAKTEMEFGSLDRESTGNTEVTFTSDGEDFNAVAQTFSPSQKSGNISFNSIGLSLPNLSGQTLAFTPYYNAFSNRDGPLGKGWSALPFEISFPEGKGFFCFETLAEQTCDPATVPATGFIAQKLIKLTDNVTTRSLVFKLAGRMTLSNLDDNEVVDQPYYISEATNDVIYQHPDGAFIYNKLNKLKQTSKQVWFKVINGAYGRYSAVPTYILDDYQENLGVVDLADRDHGGIWTKYRYDSSNRLIAIEGHNSNRINIDYSGEMISRAWYTTSSGTRDVTYSVVEDGLLHANHSSGESTGYTYSDPSIASSRFLVTDQMRNETLISTDPDIENRAASIELNGNLALAQDVGYDRTLANRSSDEGLGAAYAALELSKTTINEAGQNRSSTQYRDEHGRLRAVVSKARVANVPILNTTHYDYDPTSMVDKPLSITDARGNTTYFTYDSDGRITSITDPRSTPQIPRITTIARGVDASDLTGDVYIGGREGWKVEVITDHKGRKSASKYDMAGNLIISYRRLEEAGFSQAVKFDTNNDASDEFIFTFSNAEASVVNYLYDPASGMLASVSNTASELSATYSWITGNDSVIVSQRNSHGQAEKVTSASGYDTVYQYDGLARLVSVQSPADTLATKLNYYDQGLAQDRLNTVESALGKKEQSYDVVNRTQTSTNPQGVSTTTFYNSQSNIERVVEISPAGDAPLTTQYFYDPYGRLDYKLMPNQTRVQYTYDGFDRLQSIVELEESSVPSTNAAPVIGIAPPANNPVPVGSMFNFTVVASDANADVLRYSLVGAPEGMSIDPLTGEITWTPTADQLGEYEVVVQVVDANGGVDTIIFMVTAGESDPANDNCVGISNPAQRDTDGDGFGNRCDPDLTNDGIVNFADLAEFKKIFGFESVPGEISDHADFDGSGRVDYDDLDILRTFFGKAPGVSGVAQ